jgi:hypothetical protein
MGPLPSASWAKIAIMTECTKESDHHQSMYFLVCGEGGTPGKTVAIYGIFLLEGIGGGDGNIKCMKGRACRKRW